MSCRQSSNQILNESFPSSWCNLRFDNRILLSQDLSNVSCVFNFQFNSTNGLFHLFGRTMVIYNTYSKNGSHSENTELRTLQWTIKGGRYSESQNHTSIQWIYDSIIPQTGSGIVGATFNLIFLQNWFP